MARRSSPVRGAGSRPGGRAVPKSLAGTRSASRGHRSRGKLATWAGSSACRSGRGPPAQRQSRARRAPGPPRAHPDGVHAARVVLAGGRRGTCGRPPWPGNGSSNLADVTVCLSTAELQDAYAAGIRRMPMLIPNDVPTASLRAAAPPTRAAARASLGLDPPGRRSSCAARAWRRRRARTSCWSPGETWWGGSPALSSCWSATVRAGTSSRRRRATCPA